MADQTEEEAATDVSAAKELMRIRNRVAELEAEVAGLRAASTERRPVEAMSSDAMALMQQRYNALMSHLEVGVAVYQVVDGGRDFIFREINRAGAELVNVAADQVIGRRVTELFPGVEAFGLLEVLRRVWLSGVSERLPEARYEDGRISGWWDNVVYRLDSGEVVAVYLDRGDYKRTEAALEFSVERFQAIAETALDSIFTKDHQRRYTFVNPAMTKLLGCTAADLLGKTPEEVFPPEVAAVVRETDDAAFAGHQLNEVRELELGPEVRFLHTIQVPIRRESGRVVEICGIVRDVTEARRAEEQIRRLNEELDQRVRERTAELRSVNRELEAFAYSVSHDLRAPLRGIDGFSQILDEEYGQLLDSEGRQLVQRLRRATHRLGHLMDSLLRLSRATRGELDRDRIDLAALAAKVVAELAGLETGREVHFEARGALKVSADAILLRAALENLLSNAWKFTRRAAHPRVELVGEIVNGEQVISVRDNGVGFDMQYASKLFGAFQRLHSEEEFEGTGIGLATVARIVNRHGGRVWAESQPGQGAAFFFTLQAGPSSETSGATHD